MEELLEKKKRGRPRTSKMKLYTYKADADLIPLHERMKVEGVNRNRFVNDAIREKALREGLLKESEP